MSKDSIEEIVLNSSLKLSQDGDWILLTSQDADYIRNGMLTLKSIILDLKEFKECDSNGKSKKLVRVRREMEDVLENNLDWDNFPVGFSQLKQWILKLKKVEKSAN